MHTKLTRADTRAVCERPTACGIRNVLEVAEQIEIVGS